MGAKCQVETWGQRPCAKMPSVNSAFKVSDKKAVQKEEKYLMLQIF
jgi:hypothetical protein